MPEHESREIRGTELSIWLWLFVPLAIVAVQIGSRIVGEDVYLRWFHGENGFVENLTLLLLAVAVIAGVRVLRQRHELPDPRLAKWIGLLTIGCVYFLGEEASWGQHWFGWGTPEGFAELNDQGETNLHNLGASDWLLDNLPRNLLSAFAAVGGILVPLRRRGSRRWPASDPRDWFWPTLVCVPSAIVASVVRLPRRWSAATGRDLVSWIDISPGETEECALAAMLMLYLLSIHVRLTRQASAADS
jgi:hypothetical protein